MRILSMPVNTGIKILQQPDSLFRELFDGKRIMRDEVYHPSSFIVRSRVPEGILLFHTLSCELLLSDKEPHDLLDDDFMRDHLFVVPESLDEKELVSQYRSLRTMADAGRNFISSYTILPTTDCNARCFYCYEMGRSRINMSKETAMKVVALIEKNWSKCIPSSLKKEVTLDWFGGEPLYNSEIIDLICSELKKRGVPFKSKMISNGYLFDKQLVKKAVKAWKLQWIQITLDGTEEIYNRSKAYIYKDDKSPYQRVVKNIGLLLDAGVKVDIRMNMGLHNTEDLFSLVRSIIAKYGGKKNLGGYAHPLFETSAGSNSVKLNDDSRRLLYDKLKQLDDLMMSLADKREEALLPKETKKYWCMADNGQSIVIAPTGEIGLCEHYTDSNFFSSVDAPDEVDMAMVEKFREQRDEIELCDRCPLYPQCIRLKMCEESEICDPLKVEIQVNRIKLAMEQIYRKQG